MVKNKIICFVVDENEKSAIKENADDRSMSMSAFIRGRTVVSDMNNIEVAMSVTEHIDKSIESITQHIDKSVENLSETLHPTCKIQELKTPPAPIIPSPPAIIRKKVPTKIVTIESLWMSPEEQKERIADAKEVMIDLKECLAKRKDISECPIEILEE